MPVSTIPQHFAVIFQEIHVFCTEISSAIYLPFVHWLKLHETMNRGEYIDFLSTTRKQLKVETSPVKYSLTTSILVQKFLYEVQIIELHAYARNILCSTCMHACTLETQAGNLILCQYAHGKHSSP